MQTRRISFFRLSVFGFRLSVPVVMTVLALALPCMSTQAAIYSPITCHDVDLLPSGNLLVTDGGQIGVPNTGGVFEIDRGGNILWSYTTGLNFAHNADKQANGDVIISDTRNNRAINRSRLCTCAVAEASPPTHPNRPPARTLGICGAR